jgi:hypothetical protein
MFRLDVLCVHQWHREAESTASICQSWQRKIHIEGAEFATFVLSSPNPPPAEFGQWRRRKWGGEEKVLGGSAIKSVVACRPVAK